MILLLLLTWLAYALFTAQKDFEKQQKSDRYFGD